MKKSDSIRIDNLLLSIAKQGKSKIWSVEKLRELGKSFDINEFDLYKYISILTADKMLEPISHSSKPKANFGLYKVTDSGIRYIFKEGGYKKYHQYKILSSQDLKFRVFRHWIWFVFSIVSFLINILLLVFCTANNLSPIKAMLQMAAKMLQ